MATCRQFVSSWCELIERLLLEVREPRFDDRPHGAVLDFFVAYRTVTNLLHQMETRFSVNPSSGSHRDRQLRRIIHWSTSCDQCASGHRPEITSCARSSDALSSG